MVDDVEARLAAAGEALREFEVTNLRCADLHRRMAESATQIQSLQAEHRDAARRAGGPSGWLGRLRGDQRDWDAERAAASYRLRVAEAYLAALRQEYGSVSWRLAELAGAPATYAAVLAERKWQLLESGDPRQRLLVLDGERARLAAELPELGEALRAASIARDALREVLGRLDRVDRWWVLLADEFRDPFSHAVAYNRLAQVTAAAAYADRCLAGLRFRLAQVSGVVPPGAWAWVERTARFFDLWLDKAFGSRPVRERITRVRQQVEWPLLLVQDLYGRLERRPAEVRARLDQIEAQRRLLLAG